MSIQELNLRIRGEWPRPVIVLKAFTHHDLVHRVKEKRKLKLSESTLQETNKVADQEEKEGGDQSEETHSSDDCPDTDRQSKKMSTNTNILQNPNQNVEVTVFSGGYKERNLEKVGIDRSIGTRNNQGREGHSNCPP